MRSPMSAPLDKKAMRSAIRRALRELSPEAYLEQNQSLQTHFLNSHHFQNATSIGIYLGVAAMREVDTVPIIAQAFVDKKRVFLPTVVSDHDMVFQEMLPPPDLQPQAVRNYIDLTFSRHPKWDIPELAVEDPVAVSNTQPPPIDLLVMPGIAFTRARMRLGQGRGYYDRYLTTHGLAGSVPLVALGLRPQLVDQVPVDERDVPVDAVISPDGVVTAP